MFLEKTDGVCSISAFAVDIMQFPSVCYFWCGDNNRILAIFFFL